MRHGWTRVALLMGATIAITRAQVEARTEAAVGGTPARQSQAKAEGGADAIRPFHVHFSDEALADLKRRIAATRWPEKETVADQSQGVQLATMQKLAHYWGTDYDWRKCEARLNASRSSSPRSTASTFTSFTCVRRSRTRCRSSSRTAGPARSSSS